MIGYGNSMLLSTHGILARSASGGGVDPDAQAFITAASITDPTQQSAINTLVTDLKGYSIWTKFKAIYPIVGGSASSHAVNLVTPGTYNLTFSSGWTHSSTGMLPNGTSAYANTNLIPNSVVSLTSNHFSFYSRTNQAAAAAVDMGCSINPTEMPLIYVCAKYSSNNYLVYNPDYNVSGISVSNTDSTGYYAISRTANNLLKSYKNSTVQGTSTATIVQTGLPTVNIYISGYNYFGGTSGYSAKECAFSSIGDGLTDAEVSNLYTAVQAFQTTLGRQV